MNENKKSYLRGVRDAWKEALVLLKRGDLGKIRQKSKQAVSLALSFSGAIERELNGSREHVKENRFHLVENLDTDYVDQKVKAYFNLVGEAAAWWAAEHPTEAFDRDNSGQLFPGIEENAIMRQSDLQDRVVKLASDHPDLRKYLVPILKGVKLASVPVAEIPIDKRKLIKLINDRLSKVTKGLYQDESWRGVKKVWETLDDLDVDWVMTDNRYDREFPPKYKVWNFEVSFLNKNGRPAKLYGVVTASGAGTVDDPLGSYDVTAYVS